MSLTSILDSFASYAQGNIPGLNVPTAAAKLAEEAAELAQDPSDIREIADILLTVRLWMVAAEVSWDDVELAVERKSVICQASRWYSTADGRWKRIKGSEWRNGPVRRVERTPSGAPRAVCTDSATAQESR